MRKWLPHIIDDSQSAFVPGRDNILVGYECMHWLRNKKSTTRTYVAAKLDMSKAYDRVEWSFFKMVMESMGFGSNIVRLIMNCVASVKYSILCG